MIGEARAECVARRRDTRLDGVALALVEGARAEIALTPKPGLVDARDNGSHPDLSYEKMMRSCDLLPRYFEDLLTRYGDHLTRYEDHLTRHRAAMTTDSAPSGERALSALRARALPSCISAGRDAESRMNAAIDANAHRGYIFLSGLVLLAACDLTVQGDGGRGRGGQGEGDRVNDDWRREPRRLRVGIGDWAHAFFSQATDCAGQSERPGASMLPGAHVRATLDVGGIRREAESGLRAVFEDALPAFRRALGAAGRTSASFLAMARLMQTIEDTTSIRRGGMAGLARVRRDGAELERRLRGGENPEPLLIRWNEEYRSMNLTMGGVADCLALTLAIDAMTSG